MRCKDREEERGNREAFEEFLSFAMILWNAKGLG